MVYVASADVCHDRGSFTKKNPLKNLDFSVTTQWAALVQKLLFCLDMDTNAETLSRLDRLQASLDSLLHEVQIIRSEMGLKTKETVVQELLVVLEDVARIAGHHRDSLAPLRAPDPLS